MSRHGGINDRSANRSNPAEPARMLYNRDGIRIQTDRRGLYAYLSFTPSGSRTVLDEGTLRGALKEAKVVFGVDERAVERFSGSTDKIDEEIVARGREPIQGEPPKLDYKFSTNPYAVVGAKSDRERVDYRERGMLPFATAGTVVAILIKGTDSTPGRTVTGNEIKATLDLASGLEPGRNVEVQGDRYIAKIAGGPRLDEHGRIEISETWTVNRDIDIHTGNIRYPGPVNIQGVVHGGFEVHAGSVKIQGVENNAIVEADLEVDVSGGILGGRVRAGGGLSARFINNANLVCSGDVDVKLSIVNSDISSSGFLSSQTIIGGTISTLKGLECVNLSSEANRATVIFGVDPIKQQRISALVRKKMEVGGLIHQKKEEIEPLLECRRKLEKNDAEATSMLAERASMEQRFAHASPDDTKTYEFCKQRLEELKQLLEKSEKTGRELEKELTALKPQYATQEREIAKLEKQLQELEEEHQQISQADEDLKVPPRVIVKGTAFAGTRVSGPRARLVLPADRARVVFRERKRTEQDLANEGKEAVAGRPEYRIDIQRL